MTDPASDTTAFEAVEVVIPSDPAEARSVQDRIELSLAASDASERDIFCIKLALEEALVNAIKHGNQLDLSKSVSISYQVLRLSFEIRITDQGPGFDPDDLPDPTAIENLERPCGRGVMLMRHYMSDVEYYPPGNSLRMRRDFKPKQA
ncbi:MAG: ATP-binding protein [Gemmataceae bacterium]|jgi:serine/threonine-protein kinase RsbW|nr:ATP-binding protein [Planctomycetota bacterium]